MASSTSTLINHIRLFQKKQMEKYCLGNGNIIGNLPSTPQSLTKLFTHLLYDDSKRIVFCYVPKNGCSNMKRLLLILNGLLPPEASKQSRPSEMLLKKVNSFRNLTAQQAIYKLKNYYKFAIVRNPLERLLSAYRNKLEYPVVYGERKHFPSNLQLFIMSLFRPRQIQVWLESLPEKRHTIFPSFKEFVTYMKMFPLGDYNEHFAPFYELCQPCSVNYDFYGNFKIMDYDITSVLEYLSIPLSYYPAFVRSKNTMELVNEYYRLIPWREKTALFNAFRKDLNLYYSLYPEETGAHKQLLIESEDL
ncbi:Carbohydrate sulfotransferase 14 [Geodia barretti]|uniref:Carbohydrate sulfotransferase n=1 Tax=Geodia barretti TaxID=519541 RepID=A0AA35T0F1_GEOBA|nr:Carbohydrate sulfotransferase 14 [Geodia barretti]